MRKKQGQSLVEFAITLPLLVLLLTGAADFAMAYSTQLVIRHAVAEGGYVAAQNPDNFGLVRSKIQDELKTLDPPVNVADIVITNSNTTCNSAGGALTFIEVTYDYRLLFGIFSTTGVVELAGRTTVPQLGACMTRPAVN